MNLLFTKGIKGFVKEEKIYLINYKNNICTNYTYDNEGISLLEKEYNIKLIGTSIYDEEEYKFFVMNDKKEFLYIDKILYELEDKILNLEDLISETILKGEDLGERIYSVPIFLTTEGIIPDLFFRKKDFQNSIINSELVQFFSKEEINKIIYKYDMLSIVRSIKNYIISFSRIFIHVSDKMNSVLFQNIELFHKYNNKNNPYEYKYVGKYTIDIISLYSNIIIQMCSSLDLISKLICEICNFPTDFKNNIKFKSGNIYFKDISKYKEIFRKYEGFDNSFINNKKIYNDLIMIRNSIVHNAFFTNDESLFYGFKTSVVNNKPIHYIVSYVWDIGEDGKPERWLNRFRFYGQEREIGEYLVNYFLKFYDNMNYTIDIIYSYILDTLYSK